MSNLPVVTSSQLTPKLKFSPQWAELKKRARTLKITVAELESCETLEQFHVLVKRKYKERLKRVHPDHTNRSNPHRAKHGVRLKPVLATYKWLMAISPDTFRRTALSRVTAAECELPLDWGMGWTEYDKRYDGFTILPRL